MDHRQRFIFGFEHASQRAAFALAEGDHNAALAGLMLGKAAVLTIFLAVLGADVAAKVCAIDLDIAEQLMRLVSDAMASRILCASTQAVLKLTSRSRRQLKRSFSPSRHSSEADRGEQVGELELAARKDRPRRDAVLSAAIGTFEAAARRDLVVIEEPQFGQTGRRPLRTNATCRTSRKFLSSPAA